MVCSNRVPATKRERRTHDGRGLRLTDRFREPHWYLQAIGTDPARQGKGYGGVVMRHQLTFVDAAGLPAYLESSKEKNIPIYASFGFEVTGEIRLPGGPILYPMWRKARAA